MVQQVTRLAVAFAVAGTALIAARYYLVPDTFGELGHYRAAAIDDVVAHEKKYAGHEECSLCHSPIAQQRLASMHRGVTCEVCHGPAADHVAAPGNVKPPAPRDRGFCPLCHSYNPSRPTGFPQIDPVAHNPLMPCVTCHNPHAPEPPMAPEECSACHGQIARQKAVSHHATLACTTCHEAPEQHRVDPRSALPDKPASRAFCGQCHAAGEAASPRIPQVNLRDHGGDYNCWQCHYPHFPETS